MSYATLKWQLTCLMLRQAYDKATGETFENMPRTPFGEKAYVFGAQSFGGGFNVCGIEAQGWKTDISMYFMDWTGNPKINHADFYSNIKFVKMYGKLARGIVPSDNEYEMEIVADLIRHGYAYKKEGKILVTMPVFTKTQMEALAHLLQPATDEIAVLLGQLSREMEAVLKEHAPSHLRKQVKGIAEIYMWDEGVFQTAALLNKEGWLSTDWDVNENSTSFVVLED